MAGFADANKKREMVMVIMFKNFGRLGIFLCWILFLPALVIAGDYEEGEKLFKQGAGLFKEKKYREAAVPLEKSLKLIPGNQSILWNLSLAQSLSGEHAKAIPNLKQLLSIAPAFWEVRTKLIQAYQALGMPTERDAEIEQLISERKNHPDSTLGKSEKFCREQFSVNGKDVFAFHYFEPKSPNRMFYKFSIVKTDGAQDYFISLGSYDLTNNISREMGDISGSERLYHLDGYYSKHHETYGFFSGEEVPSYDTVRKKVVSVLEGKAKAISQSSNPPI